MAAVAGGENGGSFSPLALFECTISNASMLLDSMSVKELLCAMRIISGLHTRAVDVMDPGVCDLTDRVASSEQQQQQQQQAAVSNGEEGESLKATPPEQPKRPRKEATAPSAAAGSGGLKCERQESDDDCCILEDPSFLSQPLASTPGAAFGEGADVQQLLRATCRSLRSAGAAAYDFHRPWSDPANQKAADVIAAHAAAQHADLSIGVGEWRDLLQSALPALSKPGRDVDLRRRTNRKCGRLRAKLSRRQKAFEQVLPSLDPDDLDKYRIVLSREFTSSDEEVEEEAGEGALRVRELFWESEEVKAIKLKLDAAFVRRFATQKQRASLQRCLRSSGCRSSRSCPHAAPDWAVRTQLDGQDRRSPS